MRNIRSLPGLRSDKKNYENSWRGVSPPRFPATWKHDRTIMDFKGRRPAPGTVGPQSAQRQTADVSGPARGARGGYRGCFPGGQSRHTIDDERRLSEVSELPILGTIMMAWTMPRSGAELEGWSSWEFLGVCFRPSAAIMAHFF